MASLCVGLTLPGMMEEPGSFSGMTKSPRPQRGPEASQRMSFEIFISDAARVSSAPGENYFVVSRKRGELVAVRSEGQSSKFGDFLRGAFGKLRMSIQAGAHCCSANRQVVKTAQRLLQAIDVAFEQAGPAADIS